MCTGLPLSCGVIMYHVSFHYGDTRNIKHWDFLLTNFGIEPSNVWLRGQPEGYTGEYQQQFNPKSIPNIPTIVLAPPNGHYIQGTESLLDFQHPEICLYFFGHDHAYLHEDDLEGLNVTNYVFIPQATKHDMFAITAASCVFYDRLTKNG